MLFCPSYALRILAKWNANNRICIAEAGAIPLLLSVYCRHLSCCGLKEHVVTAALLNLSIHKDKKAILALVVLLSEGSLFNLCIYQANKGWDGLVPVIMGPVTKPHWSSLMDKAVAILSSQPEGKAEQSPSRCLWT
jgi:hypothetical protein